MRRLAALFVLPACLSTPGEAPRDASGDDDATIDASLENCAVGFADGTFDMTHAAPGTGRLVLDDAVAPDTFVPMGNYLSPIADAGADRAWNLSWTSRVPSLKPLPDGAQSDDGYASNADMTGNVMLYHLDEDDGQSTFTDGSPSNLLASCASCPTFEDGALFGPARVFTGAPDFRRITRGITAAHMVTSLTVEAWGRRDGQHNDGNLGSAGSIISMGFNGSDPFSAFALEQVENHATQTSQALRCWVGFEPNGVQIADGSPVPSGAWYHVACTYDGAIVRLFVNGHEVQSQPETRAITYGAADQTLFIGTYGNGSQAFNGAIDELAVYSRVLTEAELRDHWRRGATRVTLQVRTCDESDCSDQPAFVGPDGTASTSFSEHCNPTLGPPSGLATVDIDCDGDGDEDDGAGLAVLPRRYAQFRVHFESADVLETPELLSASLCPAAR